MKKKSYCPTCKKESDIGQSNTSRPFCSERCRLIDLGQWFEEKYTLPDTPHITETDNIDLPASPMKH